MKLRRIAFFVVAGIAATTFAHAQAGTVAGKVELVCPDRSVSTADIELAVKAANWHVSQAEYLKMRERARSVCAANLSVATLLPPERLAGDGELAFEPRR